MVSLLKFVFWEEFVFNTPFLAQELGKIVSNTVTENTNDSFFLVIFPSHFFDEGSAGLED
jgi:hypothetical protein